MPKVKPTSRIPLATLGLATFLAVVAYVVFKSLGAF